MSIWQVRKGLNPVMYDCQDGKGESILLRSVKHFVDRLYWSIVS